MGKTILLLTGSVLAIGFLMCLLRAVRHSAAAEGAPSGGPGCLTLVLWLLCAGFLLYILPLCLVLLYNLVKLVMIDKWGMYHFRQYVRYELIDTFHARYLVIWDWLVSAANRYFT